MHFHAAAGRGDHEIVGAAKAADDAGDETHDKPDDVHEKRIFRFVKMRCKIINQIGETAEAQNGVPDAFLCGDDQEPDQPRQTY